MFHSHPVSTRTAMEVAMEEKIVDFEPGVVMGALRSPAWRYFTFRGSKKDGPAKDKIYCKLCLAEGSAPLLAYCNSTSNLTNHLKHRHPSEYIRLGEKQEPKVKIQNYFATKAKPKWLKTSPKWKNLTLSLAKWLCKNSRPSNLVEDEGFISFMALACPEYEPPRARTMKKYISDLYVSEVEHVKMKLKDVEYCALTTDGGTSTNATSFQDTNVHYIDKELHLRSHCLAVTENKESHTAENYRENVDDVAEEFGIKEKVIKTVTDNENKMKAAFSKKERTGCLSHIIHISVTEGIKSTSEVLNVTEKTRKIAGKYHRSYAFKSKLEDEQRHRQLPVRPLHQDVPTRWGSTRASIESFLDKAEKEDDVEKKSSFEVSRDEFKNMEAINAALRHVKYRQNQKMSDYLLSEDDMKRLSKLHEFLTKLDIFSTTLGGDKFVTASVVHPVIASMKKLLKPDSNDPMFIARMKEVILKDFTTRAANNIDSDFLLNATALDPRFKGLKMIESKIDRERVFKKLLEELMVESCKEDPNDHIEEGQPKPKRLKVLDFDESDDEDNSSDDPHPAAAELTRYRNEPVLDRDGDPLCWWRGREQQYPCMVRLVKKYMCVPATSTQAERVFSWLGWLLNKRRLSMSGSTVNEQLFLKDNLEF